MPDEKDLFPIEEKKPKLSKRTVKVRRYGRRIEDMQICLSEDGREAFLVPVSKIKGKGIFSLVIDGGVKSVYNWKDDLHALEQEIVDAAYLALLRLGKVSEKDEITAQDKAYISRAIAATLDI